MELVFLWWLLLLRLRLCRISKDLSSPARFQELYILHSKQLTTKRLPLWFLIAASCSKQLDATRTGQFSSEVYGCFFRAQFLQPYRIHLHTHQSAFGKRSNFHQSSNQPWNAWSCSELDRVDAVDERRELWTGSYLELICLWLGVRRCGWYI